MEEQLHPAYVQGLSARRRPTDTPAKPPDLLTVAKGGSPGPDAPPYPLAVLTPTQILLRSIFPPP